MPASNEFPKSGLTKNKNFYLWVGVAGLFVFVGLRSLISSVFLNQPLPLVFESEPPGITGVIATLFGLYFLYYLFFKAEKEEEKQIEFEPIDNFEEVIGDYQTEFEIVNDLVFSYKERSIPVFYYVLKVKFNKELPFTISIKQRDKVEYFFWKIGLTRAFDILTGSKYFDSKYRVKCTNKEIFQAVFSPRAISLLEKFDREYPPIRKRNGILLVTNNFIKYTEGPYSERLKLFDPHRGNIEKLFMELVEIIKDVESNISCLKKPKINTTKGST